MNETEAAEIERLKRRVAELEQQLKASENTIRRAKDPTPVERPSARRVLKLVHAACMSLQRVASGWLLKMGHKVRSFRRLRDIWELLIADDWCLSNIFPDKSDNPRHNSFVPPRLPQRYGSLAAAAPAPG